jgi:hypothetical protein
MRQLTSHKVNECNEAIEIQVHDEPGQGNACHSYAVYGFHTANNVSADSTNKDETCLKILFQNGPIKEFGTNGITQEVLLAIVEDRLQGFQSGPYACRENAVALTKIQEAMMWLQKRTRDRLARGVEGTNQK